MSLERLGLGKDFLIARKNERDGRQNKKKPGLMSRPETHFILLLRISPSGESQKMELLGLNHLHERIGYRIKNFIGVIEPTLDLSTYVGKSVLHLDFM